MKVRNKFTNVEANYSYRTWDTTVLNKDSYEVLDAGDLVILREIIKNGERKDLYILDREHAVRMIKSKPNLYDYRELKRSDIQQMNSQTPIVSLSPYKQFLQFLNRKLPIFENHPFIRTFVLIAAFTSILGFVIYLFDKSNVPKTSEQKAITNPLQPDTTQKGVHIIPRVIPKQTFKVHEIKQEVPEGVVPEKSKSLLKQPVESLKLKEVTFELNPNTETNTHKKDETYIGTLELYTIYANPFHYRGEIKNGKANGQGVAIFKDGVKLEGVFKDNLREGLFSHNDSLNNLYYKAIYVRDSLIKVLGFPVWYSNNTGRYDGYYDGDVSQDILANGQGRFVFNGGYATGLFENGLMKGGRAFMPYSLQYTFINDKNKRVEYAISTFYEGEIYDFEPHGKGILRFNDGGYYEGTFERGLFHGDGVLVRNGITQKGKWNHGAFVK